MFTFNVLFLIEIRKQGNVGTEIIDFLDFKMSKIIKYYVAKLFTPITKESRCQLWYKTLNTTKI